MNMQILETLAYNFLVENRVVNISISFLVKISVNPDIGLIKDQLYIVHNVPA
jgi:hypothetical protein